MPGKTSLNDLLYNVLINMSEKEKKIFAQELEKTLPTYIKQVADNVKIPETKKDDTQNG